MVVTSAPSLAAWGQATYQNTGLDFLNFGQAQGVAFFDVADPDALMRELDQVR